MKKQSLIHLHELAYEIREHMEEEHDESLSNAYFQEYDNSSIYPIYANKKKVEHKEALQTLMEGLETHIEDRLEEDEDSQVYAVRS